MQEQQDAPARPLRTGAELAPTTTRGMQDDNLLRQRDLDRAVMAPAIDDDDLVFSAVSLRSAVSNSAGFRPRSASV